MTELMEARSAAPAPRWIWCGCRRGLLFGLTWWAPRKPAPGPEVEGQIGFLRRQGATVLLGVLAVGAVLAWSAVFALPDGRLHVRFLVVGSGQAVLVQTPVGEHLLLGGGRSRQRDGGPASPERLHASPLRRSGASQRSHLIVDEDQPAALPASPRQ